MSYDPKLEGKRYFTVKRDVMVRTADGGQAVRSNGELKPGDVPLTPTTQTK
jgi:hypothetical protein